MGGRGSPALGVLKEMERAAEAFDLPVPLKIAHFLGAKPKSVPRAGSFVLSSPGSLIGDELLVNVDSSAEVPELELARAVAASTVTAHGGPVTVLVADYLCWKHLASCVGKGASKGVNLLFRRPSPPS